MKHLEHETVPADPNDQGAHLPTSQLYYAIAFAVNSHTFFTERKSGKSLQVKFV